MLTTFFLLFVIRLALAEEELQTETTFPRFCDAITGPEVEVLAHSPDNKHLLLVAKSSFGFFWIISESYGELKFIKSDQAAHNHSDAFESISSLFSVGHTETYDLAVDSEEPEFVDISDLIGFNQIKREGMQASLGWVAFLPNDPVNQIYDGCINGENWGAEFDEFGDPYPCGEYIERNSKGFVNRYVKEGIGFRYKLNVRNGKVVLASNIFVRQDSDRTGKQWERSLRYIDVGIEIDGQDNSRLVFTLRRMRDVLKEYQFIEQMDPTLKLLGFMLTRHGTDQKTLYVLIRDQTTIKYCTVVGKSRNDCLQNIYKTLVNCENKATTKGVVPTIGHLPNTGQTSTLAPGADTTEGDSPSSEQTDPTPSQLDETTEGDRDSEVTNELTSTSDTESPAQNTKQVSPKPNVSTSKPRSPSTTLKPRPEKSEFPWWIIIVIMIIVVIILIVVAILYFSTRGASKQEEVAKQEEETAVPPSKPDEDISTSNTYRSGLDSGSEKEKTVRI